MLGLRHAMKDGGCLVGPMKMESCRLGEKYECLTKYGVWGRGSTRIMFLARTPIFSLGLSRGPCKSYSNKDIERTEAKWPKLSLFATVKMEYKSSGGRSGEKKTASAICMHDASPPGRWHPSVQDPTVGSAPSRREIMDGLLEGS